MKATIRIKHSITSSDSNQCYSCGVAVNNPNGFVKIYSKRVYTGGFNGGEIINFPFCFCKKCWDNIVMLINSQFADKIKNKKIFIKLTKKRMLNALEKDGS